MRVTAGAEREKLALAVAHAVDEARNAAMTGDHSYATRIWWRLESERPNELLREANAYEILLNLNRFDEAETFTAEACRRHGNTLRRLEARAQVSQRRGWWVEAVGRWDRVRKQFPDAPDSYFYGAMCLVEAGREGEAEALLARAIRRFPDNVYVHVEYAQLAVRRADW